MAIVRLGCWLMVCGVCGSAYAAEDLTVEASHKGALVEVRARATLQAPLSLVWTTLTDYERSRFRLMIALGLAPEEILSSFGDRPTPRER